MGKGSSPRPYSVKADVFSENYCMTFGHKYKAERCMNCGGAKPEGSPSGSNGQAAEVHQS